MKKDFDKWNMMKKITNSSFDVKLYHARDIWWCILGTNIGFEQDGKGNSFERPVLILKGLSPNTCLVIPLTTSKYKHKYRICLGDITGVETQVILSQMRVIDTKRLTEKIVMLDGATFEIIRKAVKDML